MKKFIEKLDINFDNMLTTHIIKIVYVIGLVGCVILTILNIIGIFQVPGWKNKLAQVLWAILSITLFPLIWRIIMETSMLLFSVHEKLSVIQTNTKRVSTKKRK